MNPQAFVLAQAAAEGEIDWIATGGLVLLVLSVLAAVAVGCVMAYRNGRAARVAAEPCAVCGEPDCKQFVSSAEAEAAKTLPVEPSPIAEHDAAWSMTTTEFAEPPPAKPKRKPARRPAKKVKPRTRKGRQ